MTKLGKKILSVLAIILLLPYILTIFMNGAEIQSVNLGESTNGIIVQVEGEESGVLWEEYLVGILAREIPTEYDLEAMKAQAVMIRTRLYLESGGDPNHVYDEVYYDVVDVQEKWENENTVEIYQRLNEAVESTEDEILMYNDGLVVSPYHFLSLGQTRSGVEVLGASGYEYLESVSCPLDLEHELQLQVTEMSYDEVSERLDLGASDLYYSDFQILSTDHAGYVMEVRVQEGILQGEDFRKLMDLSSGAFVLQEIEEGIKITTSGVGHGLGLSQNTAHYMALEGKSYREILQYFYKGVELKSFEEINLEKTE